MNGRIYDPNLGRFMSVDPFIQSPTNTQSINAYSYIMNNPVNGIDPSGYTSTSDDTSDSGDTKNSAWVTIWDRSLCSSDAYCDAELERFFTSIGLNVEGGQLILTQGMDMWVGGNKLSKALSFNKLLNAFDSPEMEDFDPSSLDGENLEIYKLMQNKNYAKALTMIVEEYGDLIGLNEKQNVIYSNELRKEGTVAENGDILIGKAAFIRGPGWLASIVYHEYIHYQQGWWGELEDVNLARKYEAEAYLKQWQASRIFGLSQKESDALWYRRDYYLD
ncbi:hypothetical protein FNN08_14405 [Thalassomonas sp. M1454]|nr:RHS repeat-associated core domain-containing protein [Thalassomonas sp. M1454]TRX53462.1 hypothetical protein FNN08_14405 [Thalassomonas sp. M1454]